MKTKYVVIISVCVIAFAIILYAVSNKKEEQQFDNYSDDSNVDVEEVEPEEVELKEVEPEKVEQENSYDDTVEINGYTESRLHRVYDTCAFGCDLYTGDKYPVCTIQSAEVIELLCEECDGDAVVFNVADCGTYSDGVITYYDNVYYITFDYVDVYYVYEEYGHSYAYKSDYSYDTVMEYLTTGDIDVLD